jgi:hypothetical protein
LACIRQCAGIGMTISNSCFLRPYMSLPLCIIPVAVTGQR